MGKFTTSSETFIVYRKAVMLYLVLSSFASFSQRKIDKTIILNTETGRISDDAKANIPFDEVFYIKGTFSKREVSSVQLKYKIKGYCKNAVRGKNCNKIYKKTEHYYLLENAYPMDHEGYITLPKVKVDTGKTFEILMDPLHDNEIYILEFTFFEKIGIDAKDQESLKNEILIEINKTYDPKKATIPTGAFDKLNTDLEKIVKKMLGPGSLFDESNNPINLKNQIGNNNEIGKIFQDSKTVNDNMFASYQELKYSSNINNFSISTIMSTLDTKRSSISNAIATILTKKELEDKLKEKVNSVINEKITLGDMLEFISNDLNRWSSTSFNKPDTEITNSYILEILMGRGKIVDNIIKNTNRRYNLESGQLLLSAFINLDNIKYSGTTKAIPSGALTPIISNLEKWCTHMSNLEFNNGELKNLINEFQDIYTNVYTQYKFALPASTIENIETKDSKYFGVDIGVMMAPDIGSTFFFEGINFHLRPVNRRTNFSELKYGDSVWKRLSLFGGIAQRIGSYEDNYKNLIGIGSPFAGVGWRFHKGFRVNGGFLWYKAEDQHPLIIKTSVEVTYFLSISIDVAFKDIVKTALAIK